jgi:predicted exporter
LLTPVLGPRPAREPVPSDLHAERARIEAAARRALWRLEGLGVLEAVLSLCTKIVPVDKVAVQIANVRETLIEKIAYVRNKDQKALEAEIDAKGDLEIDSKVGQAVVGYLEMALECEGLVRVEDQTKENLTSLNGLQAMVERRRRETGGDTDG